MPDEQESQRLPSQESASSDPEADLVAMQVAAESSFSGPIPPPEVMRGYEDIQAGLATRIFEMAEREQAHHHSLAQLQIELARTEYFDASTRSKMGLYLGAVVVVAFVAATAAIAYFGHAWPAAALGTSSAASIAGVFVYGSREQRRSDSLERQ